MTEWQPIETAPKDGTWFAAWDRKHQWRDRPPVCIVRVDGPWFCDAHGNGYSNLTHWMPLPAPPEKSND